MYTLGGRLKSIPTITNVATTSHSDLLVHTETARLTHCTVSSIGTWFAGGLSLFVLVFTSMTFQAAQRPGFILVFPNIAFFTTIILLNDMI
jgi:hypothetical protein